MFKDMDMPKSKPKHHQEDLYNKAEKQAEKNMKQGLGKGTAKFKVFESKEPGKNTSEDLFGDLVDKKPSIQDDMDEFLNEQNKELENGNKDEALDLKGYELKEEDSIDPLNSQEYIAQEQRNIEEVEKIKLENDLAREARKVTPTSPIPTDQIKEEIAQEEANQLLPPGVTLSKKVEILSTEKIPKYKQDSVFGEIKVEKDPSKATKDKMKEGHKLDRDISKKKQHEIIKDTMETLGDEFDKEDNLEVKDIDPTGEVIEKGIDDLFK